MDRRLRVQFPEERNALVFVLGQAPVDEVEPFAPLDRPFRISQLVLASAANGPTHGWQVGLAAGHPQPEETHLLEIGTHSDLILQLDRESTMH